MEEESGPSVHICFFPNKQIRSSHGRDVLNHMRHCPNQPECLPNERIHMRFRNSNGGAKAGVFKKYCGCSEFKQRRMALAKSGMREQGTHAQRAAERRGKRTSSSSSCISKSAISSEADIFRCPLAVTAAVGAASGSWGLRIEPNTRSAAVWLLCLMLVKLLTICPLTHASKAANIRT